MKINKLSYNPKWLDYKFLTQEELENQLNEYDKEKDINDEHYRYKSFCNYIERNSKFTDSEIKQFIELASIDPDQTMSGSAMSNLIQSGKLSTSQYLSVKLEFIKYGEWTKKVIDRVENPDKEAFNKGFCEQLTTQINEQLLLINKGDIVNFWCDGIEYQFYSKKYINDNRKLKTRMWVGLDGQTEYQVTIKFGKYSLRRYAKGTDMKDCIPSENIENWMTINEGENQIIIKLK